MKTALELLEHLQSGTAIRWNTINANTIEKMMSNKHPGFDLSPFKQQLAQILSTAHTKYQNPLTYSILREMIDEFQGLFPQIKAESKNGKTIRLQDFPIFGTVDMGEFSAQIRVDSDDQKPLMVFSDGFFGFANLISKIVAFCFPVKEVGNQYAFSTDINDVIAKIASDKKIAVYFFDLMFAYLLERDPHRAKQYFQENQHIVLVSMILNAFEGFVVAHEYAHYVLGHLGNQKTFGVVQINDKEIESILFNWSQEIEADTFAAQLTVVFMQSKGYDKSIAGLGIWVALNVLEILYKLRRVYKGENPDSLVLSKTHPPVSERKIKVLEQLFEKDSKEIKLLETIDFIFEKLWKTFDEFISILKNKGIKLANLDFATIQKYLYSTLPKL